MLEFWLLMLLVFILTVTAVVAVTEGFQIKLAGVIGFFSLAWGYMLVVWSSFVELVITPAINTSFRGADLTVLSIAQTILFWAWIFILGIAVLVTILTASKGSPRPYA